MKSLICSISFDVILRGFCDSGQKLRATVALQPCDQKPPITDKHQWHGRGGRLVSIPAQLDSFVHEIWKEFCVVSE